MNRKTSVGILMAAFVGLWGLTAQAATITVNNVTDEVSVNGNCTLREAVAAAETDAAVDACTAGGSGDTILLPAGNYRLNGPIVITKGVAFQGVGAGQTVIDGNGAVSLFNITAPYASFVGMTLQKGLSNAADGGAILFQGGGSLMISGCDISYNYAQNGGGIAFGGSQLWIYDSSITNNAASQNGGGLSLSLMGSEVHITNTTIGLNVGNASGGGIAVSAGGKVALINDTVSANASASGGGLSGASAALSVKNTIIAGNAGGNCVGTASSQGHNIDNEASCGLGDPTDKTADPLLGPLQNNGGTTPTFALLSSSPAVDTADAAACPPDDQRGLGRPGGAGCDIGAFELNAGPAPAMGGNLASPPEGGSPSPAGEAVDNGIDSQVGGTVPNYQPSNSNQRGSRHVIKAANAAAYHLPWIIKVDLCGDGKRETGEQCDDGNKMNGDGCNSKCRLEKNPPQ